MYVMVTKESLVTVYVYLISIKPTIFIKKNSESQNDPSTGHLFVSLLAGKSLLKQSYQNSRTRRV